MKSLVGASEAIVAAVHGLIYEFEKGRGLFLAENIAISRIESLMSALYEEYDRYLCVLQMVRSTARFTRELRERINRDQMAE